MLQMGDLSSVAAAGVAVPRRRFFIAGQGPAICREAQTSKYDPLEDRLAELHRLRESEKRAALVE
jgi:hypothetical protein